MDLPIVGRAHRVPESANLNFHSGLDLIRSQRRHFQLTAGNWPVFEIARCACRPAAVAQISKVRTRASYLPRLSDSWIAGLEGFLTDYAYTAS